MINDVNHLILIGTLGEDVKILETKNGEPMAILNIATNAEWIEGFEVKKRTFWNKVFFFGDQAQACMHYKKGMKVHVTAEVQKSNYPKVISKPSSLGSMFGSSILVKVIVPHQTPYLTICHFKKSNTYTVSKSPL